MAFLENGSARFSTLLGVEHDERRNGTRLPGRSRASRGLQQQRGSERGVAGTAEGGPSTRARAPMGDCCTSIRKRPDERRNDRRARLQQSKPLGVPPRNGTRTPATAIMGNWMPPSSCRTAALRSGNTSTRSIPSSTAFTSTRRCTCPAAETRRTFRPFSYVLDALMAQGSKDVGALRGLRASTGKSSSRQARRLRP